MVRLYTIPSFEEWVEQEVKRVGADPEKLRIAMEQSPALKTMWLQRYARYVSLTRIASAPESYFLRCLYEALLEEEYDDATTLVKLRMEVAL